MFIYTCVVYVIDFNIIIIIIVIFTNRDYDVNDDDVLLTYQVCGYAMC